MNPLWANLTRLRAGGTLAGRRISAPILTTVLVSLALAGCTLPFGPAAKASPQPSPSAPSASATPASADSTENASWFTTTSVIPGGGSWEAFPTMADATADRLSVAHHGHVSYDLTPVTPTTPSISVSGPDEGFPGPTLDEAAAKVVKSICKGAASAPGSSTVGDQQALGYTCTDSNGKSAALAVWVHDGETFFAEYSAQPSDFSHYTPVFDAVLKSFRFSASCLPENFC